MKRYSSVDSKPGEGTQSAVSSMAVEPKQLQPHGFPFNKVWFLLRSISSADIYSIFLVDMNSLHDHVGPVLQLDESCNSYFGCAVSDSKVYIFGGVDRNAMWWTKETFILDLKADLPSTSPPILSKESLSLKRGRDMSSRKIYPYAAVIELEEGPKFCVFSSVIQDYSPNFELFDPKNGSWTDVPDPFSPPDDLEDDSPCYVEACHTEKSCLWISTTSGSNYIIDFADEELKWKLSDTQQFSESCMKVDRNVFTPLGQYFPSALEEPYVGKAAYNGPLYRNCAWMALLDCKLCLCRVGYNPDVRTAPYLCLDLFHCDSDTLGEFSSFLELERKFPIFKNIFLELNCSIGEHEAHSVYCGGYLVKVEV